MKYNRFALPLAAVMFVGVGAAVVVACSSDSSSSTGTTSSTTVKITAAAGGTVADPAGTTKLVIPPGALDKDTEITLNVGPASAGSVVGVSEFLPDGLKFLKPVTLSIKADAGLAPAGKSLSLAVLDGAAFKAVDGSAYANGAATASISHFSKYSVIFIDGQAVLQPPANCKAAIDGFVPCGGDMAGKWKFADFCMPPQDMGGSAETCPEVTADLDVTLSREVTIDATTIVTSAGSAKMVTTINWPLICFGRMPDGGTVDAGINDCAAAQTAIYKDKAGVTCVDKSAGVCACTESQEQQQAATTQTYTTSGNTATIKGSDGSVETADYCVKGNLLQYKMKDQDGGVGTLVVLERLP